MRIAILDDAGFGANRPGMAGKELYVELLAQINEKILNNHVLRILLGSNINNDVITIRGSNTPIIKIFYDNLLERQLYKLWKHENVDLIHSNINNPRYIRHVIKVAERLEIPIVTTLHGWGYLCPSGCVVVFPENVICKNPDFQARCIKCLYYIAKRYDYNIAKRVVDGFNLTYSLRLALRSSLAVISPSKILANNIRKILSLKNVWWLPNPLPPNILDLKPKYDGDGSVVFYGRLTYEKGAHLLPIIAKKLQKTTVHVMGTGPLKKFISYTSSLYNNLIYHGYVPETIKIDIIKNSSLVIMPVMYCDTYPYSVLEAFALGKPIITFGLCGPKEMVEMSGGGVNVKPFLIDDFINTIRQLLKNKNNLIDLGIKGRKWAEKLTLKNYAKVLYRIYKSLY